MMTHENGAISDLNTIYAPASKYHIKNVYGKKMSASYNPFDGLRARKQGEDQSHPFRVSKVDAIVEQLVEWADAASGSSVPEVGGESPTKSLTIMSIDTLSADEGRHFEAANVLASKMWSLMRSLLNLNDQPCS